MACAQLTGGALSTGSATGSRDSSMMKATARSSPPQHSLRVHNCLALVDGKKLRHANVGRCSLSTNHTRMVLSSPIIHRRKCSFWSVKTQLRSDCSVRSAGVEEGSVTEEEHALLSSKEKVHELMEPILSETSDTIEKEFTENASNQSHSQDVKRELIMLSLPAIAGQAIEPCSQLMETAYIGRLDRKGSLIRHIDPVKNPAACIVPEQRFGSSGPVELASAGISMSIFNIVSKLFNIPLLSVATSFVAEDISKNANGVSLSEENGEKSTNGKPFDGVTPRPQLSSVSTALLLAVGIGIFEALALSLGSGLFLNLMGVSSASSMHALARKFLSLRALGAPAVVVSLALQGIFRGFKDTQTPVLCIGNFSAIFLLPILMYYFGLGVTGAAISTVISQYIVTFLMIWYLNKRAVLLPPKMGSLQFGGYLKSGKCLFGNMPGVGSDDLRWNFKGKNLFPVSLTARFFKSSRSYCLGFSFERGVEVEHFAALSTLWLSLGGFLIGRTLAVLTTTTLGTSMAARQGPLAMAAHQICLQVWLAVSLLTDALAASAQALIATSVSKGDYRDVKEITYFVLKIGLLTGVCLAAVLGMSFSSVATLFTKDAEVLGIVRTGVLFVGASQPINALAFIFDGLHYGISDFSYAAHSMMLVGTISSAFLLYAPSKFGLPGVWFGLTLFMALRMVAGFIRLSSKTGPWWFLYGDLKPKTMEWFRRLCDEEIRQPITQ
ncbi:hypothetical protein LguiA_027714 [Lonicera macranthoides]